MQPRRSPPVNPAPARTPLETGLAHYNGGRPGQALECFRRAAENGEKSAEARCFMAHCLHALGRSREARSLLAKLIRSEPSYLPARLGLASVLELSGRLGQARVILEKAVERDLKNPRARTALSGVLRNLAVKAREEGNFKQAEKYWSELLAWAPDDKEAGGALEWFKSRRAPKAAPRKIAKKPPVIGGRQKLFQALLRRGKFRPAFELAEALLDEKSDLRPNQAFWWPWYKRETHRKILDRLIRSDPSPWAYYYRGLLRGAEGFDWEGNLAELSYLERLSKFQASRYGWMNVRAGQAFLLAGRHRKAAKLLEKALRCRPVDWPLHAYRAEVFLCQDKPARALAEMDRAFALAPRAEKGKVLGWRGEIELWRGNYDEAFRLADAACAQGADFAFCWRGAAKLKQGYPRKALRYLDRAIEKIPSDLESRVWRGEARRELGMFRQALSDLNRVPDWIWGRWNRALVYAALGDEKRLRKEFLSLPGYAVDYAREKIGISGRRALSADEMKRILSAGLEMSRGFRRNGYRQAVWIKS